MALLVQKILGEIFFLLKALVVGPLKNFFFLHFAVIFTLFLTTGDVKAPAGEPGLSLRQEHL